MKKVFILSLVLFCCSCTWLKPKVCTVETAVSNALGATIGSGLSCTNVAQIQSDLLSALGKANVCEAQSSQLALKSALRGPVGDVVCPLAVNAALGLLANQIPASWGCSPQASIQGLATVLTAACEQVAPI